MRSFKNKRLILCVGVKLNLQHWVPPSSYSITFTIPSVAIATIQPHNQPINLCQRNHHVKACSQSAMLRYINCHQPIDYLCERNAFHICRWHSQLLSNRDLFFLLLLYCLFLWSCGVQGVHDRRPNIEAAPHSQCIYERLRKQKTMRKS